ncbi:MAG: transcriptional regulator NrdR [Clostridiales bacterium]|jgi:transcriptional repressor NrdR|nr:transcriptional regulator NrdR [Clostridiales bacterium]MDD3418379.1 transcriptional regulator NrdR [Eubacteriales bacterium]MDY0119335.1 transcriptional regulator NrdR [Clostridia bacterium]NLG30784.1 transcriptional repressor NrdR [Clostridiaceae bacterium]MCK9350148.1 transcriptional regulator NrdR [Clostridiales bacterium]
MKCPNCESNDDRVVDSRPSDDGSSIRRRRECLTCGTRFTTYEKIEDMPLMVIKKDGSRQAFDRQKLLIGIMKSCEKRPVTTRQVEDLIDEVERAAGNALKREISSSDIGELVLKELRGIDEVAYIRFASVYRAFRDIRSFIEEISNLLQDEGDAPAKTEGP